MRYSKDIRQPSVRVIVLEAFLPPKLGVSVNSTASMLSFNTDLTALTLKPVLKIVLPYIRIALSISIGLLFINDSSHVN